MSKKESLATPDIDHNTLNITQYYCPNLIRDVLIGLSKNRKKLLTKYEYYS